MYRYSDLCDVEFPIEGGFGKQPSHGKVGLVGFDVGSLANPPSTSALKRYGKPDEKPFKSYREYTKEERSRGGIQCASRKLDRAHTAIDKLLPGYVRDLQIDLHIGLMKRFVMARFVEFAMPNIKNVKDAVRRYGAYIKAKLKSFEEVPAVAKLGEFIDKIRAGLAKRLAKPQPDTMFAKMKGHIVRLSSNVWRTSLRHEGAGWIPTMGIWAYFVTSDGECVQ